MAADPGQLRIGEFARRVGVSPELLRAWERRYGLTRPVRSPGGFRLYTAADAARVERMRRGLDEGLSAAEAARAALEDERPSEGSPRRRARLRGDRPLRRSRRHSVLDESLAAFGLEQVLSQVVLPTAKEVGDVGAAARSTSARSTSRATSSAAGYFALADSGAGGTGPLALPACAPARCTTSPCSRCARPALSLWRILFSADTPIATLAHAAETTQPALSSSQLRPALLEAQAAGLRRLARAVSLARRPRRDGRVERPPRRPPPWTEIS
jgi:DNA-binding transcriptional MerR regulator